jgi:hypothetical protein
MRIPRFLALLTLLAAMTLVPSSCGKDDSLDVPTGKGSPVAYSPSALAIVSLEAEATVSGLASSGPGGRLDLSLRLRIRNDSGGRLEDPVTLHISRGCRVEAVTKEDGAPLSYQPFVGQIRVTPDRPLDAGEERTWILDLSFVPRSDRSGILCTNGELLALPQALWLPRELPHVQVGEPRPLRPTPSYRIRVTGQGTCCVACPVARAGGSRCTFHGTDFGAFRRLREVLTGSDR